MRTALAAARSRVAPLKPLTIPRLELQAAVMGSRLGDTITSQHSLKISKKFFWTDSQTVMNWISSDARKYQPFVAHRIADILDLTSMREWKWVPTKENVADDVTRDTVRAEITSSSRWLTGPEFLARREEDWPTGNVTPVASEQQQELKREFTLVVRRKEPLIDSTRFSSWKRLICIMARVLRFIEKCRNHDRQGGGRDLTAPEIDRGETATLRVAQMEDFADDFNRLEQDRKLSPSSRILELSAKLGNDGLLRMDGRISSCRFSQSVREPIILNGTNRIVRLLIAFYHTNAGHIGRERVINELRQKYWITKIRSSVRAVWHACATCKVRKAQPVQPEMAPLPDVRTECFIPPFTNSGVDYLGPMNVVVGRRRETRYGVLFTCLNVRAVHLEIANSLSTDSMMMALRRMIARRGKPKTLYSDNGTNFVGANTELQRALQDFDQEEITRQTAIHGIEWHFIPPGSPHMGGCWERLVRSVKRALEAALREQAPKDEVLQTLFAEAEFSVNSRPLTYVSDDPADPESLTPNHILLMWRKHEPIQSAPGVFVTDDLKLRKQWRRSQVLADLFWQRWVKEYLPPLNRRTKWHQRTENLKIDDLVIIWDNQHPRNQWKRGIITALYPGKDGRVRVADVRTTTGTYRRPVSKLCVLMRNNGISDHTEIQEEECRERNE